MLLQLATALALLGGPDGPAAGQPPHVRPTTAPARVVIDDGLRRSTTLQGLVAQLQACDVIVYVEMALMKDGARGFTTILGMTPASRVLRVSVNLRLGPRERIEVLGHELHHALEIATATDVIDPKTFRAFYKRVGWESGQGFETAAAQRVEGEVHRDLSRPTANGAAGLQMGRFEPL